MQKNFLYHKFLHLVDFHDIIYSYLLKKQNQEYIFHEMIKEDFWHKDFDNIQSHFLSQKLYKKPFLQLKKENPSKFDQRFIWDYFYGIFESDNLQKFQQIESLNHFLNRSFKDSQSAQEFVRYPISLMLEADSIHIFQFFSSHPNMKSIVKSFFSQLQNDVLSTFISYDSSKIFQYCFDNDFFDLSHSSFSLNSLYHKMSRFHSLKIAHFLFSEKKYPLPKNSDMDMENPFYFLVQKLILENNLEIYTHQKNQPKKTKI